MKIHTKQRNIKKIIIALVILVLCSFCFPKNIMAWPSADDVAAAPAQLLFWMEKGILTFLNDTFSIYKAESGYAQEEGELIEYLYVYLTPENIIKGKFLIFEANIFKEIEADDEYYDYIDPSMINDVDHNIAKAVSEGRAALRNTVSAWYYALRNLAIVALLSVLVYVGIRMVISTVSQDKAKYKVMFKDWLVALCLLFVVHYIMIGILNVTSDITEVLGNGANTNMITDTIDRISAILDSEDYEYEDTQTKIKYDIGDAYAYIVVLIGVIGFILIFAVKYLKRQFTIIFLILLAPISCITYPIDKISDGKAQAYNKWFQEFLYQVIIQPFHLLIYIVLVGTASELANSNILYAIVCFAVMIPAEKFIKSMFGFKDQLSSPLGAFGAGAIASQIFNKAKGAVSSVANKGKGDDGDKGDSGDNSNVQTKDPVLPGSGGDDSHNPQPRIQGGNNDGGSNGNDSQSRITDGNNSGRPDGRDQQPAIDSGDDDNGEEDYEAGAEVDDTSPITDGEGDEDAGTEGDDAPPITDGEGDEDAGTEGDDAPPITDGEGDDDAGTEGDDTPPITDGEGDDDAGTEGDDTPPITDGEGDEDEGTEGDEVPVTTNIEGDEHAGTEGDGTPSITDGESDDVGAEGDEVPVTTDIEGDDAGAEGEDIVIEPDADVEPEVEGDADTESTSRRGARDLFKDAADRASSLKDKALENDAINALYKKHNYKVMSKYGTLNSRELAKKRLWRGTKKAGKFAGRTIKKGVTLAGTIAGGVVLAGVGAMFGKGREAAMLGAGGGLYVANKVNKAADKISSKIGEQVGIAYGAIHGDDKDRTEYKKKAANIKKAQAIFKDREKRNATAAELDNELNKMHEMHQRGIEAPYLTGAMQLYNELKDDPNNGLDDQTALETAIYSAAEAQEFDKKDFANPEIMGHEHANLMAAYLAAGVDETVAKEHADRILISAGSLKGVRNVALPDANNQTVDVEVPIDRRVRQTLGFDIVADTPENRVEMERMNNITYRLQTSGHTDHEIEMIANLSYQPGATITEVVDRYAANVEYVTVNNNVTRTARETVKKATGRKQVTDTEIKQEKMERLRVSQTFNINKEERISEIRDRELEIEQSTAAVEGKTQVEVAREFAVANRERLKDNDSYEALKADGSQVRQDLILRMINGGSTKQKATQDADNIIELSHMYIEDKKI